MNDPGESRPRPEGPQQERPAPPPVDKVKSDAEKLPEKLKPEGEKLPEKIKFEQEKPVEKIKSDHEKPVEKVKSDGEKLPEKLKPEGEKLPEKIKFEQEKPVEKIKSDHEKPVEKAAAPEGGVADAGLLAAGQPDRPLDVEALGRYAEALEGMARELRHFIEQHERPDLSRGALADEPDQREGET
jgi:hypothetical protein